MGITTSKGSNIVANHENVSEDTDNIAGSIGSNNITLKNHENLTFYKMALEHNFRDSQSQLKVYCAEESIEIPFQWIQSSSPLIRQLLLGVAAEEMVQLSNSMADPVALMLPHVKAETFHNLVEILVYGQVIIGNDHERIENELLELAQVLQVPIERFVLESSPKRLKVRNIEELVETSDESNKRLKIRDITQLLEHETSDGSSPLIPADPAVENDNIASQGTENHENDNDWQCGNISYDDQPYCDDLSLKITIENDCVIEENNNTVKSELYCQLCDTIFPSSVQAKEHFMESDIGYMCYDGKINSKYSCSFRFCYSKFDSPIYLYRHEQMKHRNNDSPFKCKTCPESAKFLFDDRSPFSLMHHERNKHGHDIHMIFKTNRNQELTFSYKTIAPKDKKHLYDRNVSRYY